MEDAATAEISRSQVWQWIRHGVRLADGSVVTRELVRRILEEEFGKIRAVVGEATYTRGHHDAARDVFEAVALGEPFVEFLTLPASERIDL
jgi:malate synthase